MTKFTCIILVALTSHARSNDNFDQVQMSMDLKKSGKKGLKLPGAAQETFGSSKPKCEDCRGPKKNECWDPCGHISGKCDRCDSADGKFAGACCRRDDKNPNKWHAQDSSDQVCLNLNPTMYDLEIGHHTCILIPNFPNCKRCKSSPYRRTVTCDKTGCKIKDTSKRDGGDHFMECFHECGGHGKFTGWCDACNSKSGTKGACCKWNGPKDDNAPCHWKEPNDDDQQSKKKEKFHGIYGYHVCVLPADAHMKCDDVEYGFVSHGASINSVKNKFAKSCPKSEPNVEANKVCTDEQCDVASDRMNCCQKNTCTCNKGKAKGSDAGGTCTTHHAEDCQKCDAGYHLKTLTDNTQVCQQNTCVCKNGVKTEAGGSGPSLCEEHGTTDCSKCDDGFHQNATFGKGSQHCKKNVCTCPGDYGPPSDGTDCKTNGAESCKSCKDGYELKDIPGGKNKKCYANTCQNIDPTKVDSPKNAGKKLDGSEIKGIDFVPCNNVKTKEHCSVKCAAGYAGSPETWTCGTDGTVTGKAPTCEPQTCSEKMSNKITSDLAVFDCANKKTNDVCKVMCKSGYKAVDGDGNVIQRWEYTCTKDGWTGTDYQCKPKPCAGKKDDEIQNGKAGTCNGEGNNGLVQPGATCNIACDEGYTPNGITKCEADTQYSDTATCVEESCSVSAPQNGKMGGCTPTLTHNAKCTFACDKGYVTEESSCSLGKFKTKGCVLERSCPLVHTKWCKDKEGYWTDADKYLDYDGCETYCNEMHEQGKTGSDKFEIRGCELSGASAARNAKGNWCFAHVVTCSLGADDDNSAAAVCTTLSYR